MLRGKPFANRLLFGLLKPKRTILGADVAGEVEAVGSEVKELKVEDAVFGDLSGKHWGGLGEYVCARESTLALKPEHLSFTQAAATPQAGLLALQGLLSDGVIEPGQEVLINGAGGGVGTFAVQIAKAWGARVTGVDSAEKLPLIRSLGADAVFDYAREDYTDSGQRYDLILDMVARHSPFAYLRALRPGGRFVVVGGSSAAVLGVVSLGALPLKGHRKLSLLLYKANEKMSRLQEWMKSGKVKPVVERTYALEQVPDAVRDLEQGHAQGKLVVTLN